MKNYLVLLGFLYTFNLLAQNYCDNTLKPSKISHLAYKQENNRCEGFYIGQNTIKSLDIVSLTIGKLNYQLDSTNEIQISIPQLKNDSAYIRAVAIPLRTYYRLDAQIKSNQKLIWPIGDYLFPNTLTKRKIGIYGWKKNENEKTYIPVKASDNKADTLDKNIYMKVRPSVDVEAFRYRILEKDGKKVSLPEEKIKLNNSYFRRGKALEINISEKVIKKNTDLREVLIEVKAKEKNGNWLMPVKAKILLKPLHEK